MLSADTNGWCMKSFVFGSRWIVRRSFADVVDGYFEEWTTSFKDLPNLVYDTVRLDDYSLFGFVAFGPFHRGEEERAGD